MVIYQITNQITNDFYIGKTINKIQVRFYHHKYNAINKKSQTYLHRAIRKYGIENFSIIVLEEIQQKELLNEKEIFWIEKLLPKYNMTKGGDGGDVSNSPRYIESQKNKLYKHSKETKNKIRQAHLGKSKPLLSEEHKLKISQGNLGKKRPERSSEWKRKQSESQKGKIPWNKGLKSIIK
jgi:group I intron endonuclease